MHVHHPRGGAVLRRGHLRAALLIFALLLVLVFLQEEVEQRPSHPHVERDPGGRREGFILLTHLGAPRFPEGSP